MMEKEYTCGYIREIQNPKSSQKLEIIISNLLVFFKVKTSERGKAAQSITVYSWCPKSQQRQK